MTMPTWSAQSRLGGTLQRRRGDGDRQAAVLGGVFVVNGTIEIAPFPAEDVELLIPVLFPIRFLGDRTTYPTITGSGIPHESTPIQAGAFPRWNVGGTNFIYSESPGGSRVYSGCDLLVVASGSIGFRSFITWQAVGRGLVNPDRPGPTPGISG